MLIGRYFSLISGLLDLRIDVINAHLQCSGHVLVSKTLTKSCTTRGDINSLQKLRIKVGRRSLVIQEVLANSRAFLTFLRLTWRSDGGFFGL